MQITFKKAQVQDLDLVNAFLIQHFFSREPLGLRLGIRPELDTKEWISQVTEPLLKQNMSCMAVKGDALVGLCLNKIEHSDPKLNIPGFAEAVEGKDIFMNQILEFMDVLYKDVHLFETFQVDKMLVLNMICVSPEESGKGVALEMMNWSQDLASKNSISVLTAETTGIASSKVFQKANYEKVKEFKYDDYVDSKGTRPFQNLSPNESCSVWIKKLPVTPR